MIMLPCPFSILLWPPMLLPAPSTLLDSPFIMLSSNDPLNPYFKYFRARLFDGATYFTANKIDFLYYSNFFPSGISFKFGDELSTVRTGKFYACILSYELFPLLINTYFCYAVICLFTIGMTFTWFPCYFWT